jgi:hypothetical protein
MQQWTPAQVHDTVAAIVSQADFGGGRQSLLGRFIRFLAERLSEFFGLMRGSLDARLVVIAAVLLIVLIIVARIVVDHQLEARRRRGFDIHGTRGERRDFWGIARELAAAERFIDASHALYAAVLESLSSAGAVKYHASKTTGDYWRELRRGGSPVATEFRSFGRDFDRAVYGRSAVTRDEYQRLLDAAERVVGAVSRGRAA